MSSVGRPVGVLEWWREASPATLFDRDRAFVDSDFGVFHDSSGVDREKIGSDREEDRDEDRDEEEEEKEEGGWLHEKMGGGQDTRNRVSTGRLLFA